LEIFKEGAMDADGHKGVQDMGREDRVEGTRKVEEDGRHDSPVLEGRRHRLPEFGQGIHRGPASPKPVLGGGEELVGFKEMGESVVNDPLQEFAYLACEGDRSVVLKEAWGFVGFEDGKDNRLTPGGGDSALLEATVKEREEREMGGVWEVLQELGRDVVWTGGRWP
jgi:hypothetical protein